MKTCCLIIAILVFASCNRTSQKLKTLPHDISIISVNESDIVNDGKLSDVISIDSLVFLEYTEGSIIGTINKVIVSEEYIYILDNENVNGIFCFDKKGNFVNSYIKVGRGPQEYSKIFDISFFQDRIYVFAEPNQFFVLNKSLEYIESIEIKWTEDIPLIQYDPYFSVIDSETILFYHPSAPYHYHIYNLNKGDFISSHIKRLGTFDISFYKHITKNDSGIIFLSRIFNDTIYTISGKKIRPEYIVNFEKPMTDKEIEEQLKLTVFNAFNYPLPQKMYNITRFISNEEFVSFEFLFKRYGYFCFYNKEKNSVKIFNNSLGNDFFLNPTIGHYQNSIVTWIDVAGLVENRELLSFSIPDNLTYDSNPALGFYKPKFK